MALARIELSKLFRLLDCFLSATFEYIRGEPLDGPSATKARAAGPFSILKPLQRIEQKRTITWRGDSSFRPSEGCMTTRRELPR